MKGEQIESAEMSMKMNKVMKRTAVLCGTAGILLLGGTMAYLTDYDSTVNEFTVGKVAIELTEPDWSPMDQLKITPEDEIDKNPRITNIGNNDAFVYMQVSIPRAEVITADSTGSRQPLRDQELFTFTSNTGWTLMESKTVGETQLYTYVYNNILKKEESTNTLFDTVTFANIVEGQLDLAQLDIPVRAYAIQTTHTGGDKSTVLEQAKTAYQKYVNQNQSQSGEVLS